MAEFLVEKDSTALISLPIFSWGFMCRVAVLLSVIVLGGVRALSAALADTADSEPSSDSSQLTEASLEDLMKIKVYSASRYDQTLNEAPASVTIITRAEIERYGYRTLADALRSVPGFYITYDRQYSYIGSRGFGNPGDYNTRILLMVDGHRLNDAIYEQAMVGTEFPVDIDMVERIEVIRGPASSIYGTNAIFGVINVITRKAKNLGGLELSSDAGSFNTYRGRVSYGSTFHGIDTVLSATYLGSKGANELFFPAFDSPATDNGIATHADDDQYTDLLASMAARGFNFQAVYNSRNKGDPTGSWGDVFNDPRNRQTDGHGYLDLKYERALAKNWTVLARTYWDRYANDGFYVIPAADSHSVVNRDFIRGEQWGAEVQVSYAFRDRCQLIGGTEYRNQYREQMVNSDIAPSNTYLNVNVPFHTLGAYLQGECKLASKWVLTAGLRGDGDVRIGSSVNPRLSLAYTPWEKTTLKFIYGTAFRSANAYELYYSAPTSTAAMHLDPERIRTWEGDWEQRLTSNASLSVSAFDNRMRNFIAFVAEPDGLLTFSNVTDANAAGVEVELHAQWRHSINLRTSYSYQNATNGVTGQWLVNSPRDLAKLNVDAPLLWRKLRGGLEAQYVSQRLTLNGTQLSGYTVFNATLLTQKLTNHFTFSGSLYNLFNETYYDPGAQQNRENILQQDGRGFRVQLVFHLGAD